MTPSEQPLPSSRGRSRTARRFGGLALVAGFAGVLALPIALAQVDSGDRSLAKVVKIEQGADFSIEGGPLASDPSAQALSPPVVSGNGSPDGVSGSSIACKPPGCQNYRLELDLDKTPGAINFLQISLDWEVTATTPPLGLVAVSLKDIALPDLDMYVEAEDFVWEKEDDPNTPEDESDYNYRDFRNTDGAGASNPELTAVTSTDGTSVYYLSVVASAGAAVSYTLHFHFTNELFGPRDEILPPGFHGNTGSVTRPAPSTGTSSGGGGLVLSPRGPSSLNPIGKVPIGADSDFAGFGLDINSGVGKNTAADLANARDAAVVRAPDPGAPAILLWVLLVPIGLASIGGTWLYRRRPVSLRIAA